MPIVLVHIKFLAARNAVPEVPAPRLNVHQIFAGAVRTRYDSHWKQCSQYQRRVPVAPLRTRVVRSPHGHMGVGFCFWPAPLALA